MYLGVHVSISGKIYEAIDRGQALGCSAIQIFSRNPRQWRQRNIDDKDAQEFRRRREASGIKVVAVHIPYLINLATHYDNLYEKSIEAYIEDMRETDFLGAQYLVTHMGSFKDSTKPEGLKRFVGALDIILKETRDLKGVKLLLENTAGSGNWLGYTFDHHKHIFDHVKNNSRLGLCLDTAHIFSAGIDIRTHEIFDCLMDDIASDFGKDALSLVHLNDSTSDCGTHIDHHDHIGKGFIGLKSFKHIVNHPMLQNAALILETPKDTPRDDKLNLNRVKKLIGTD